MRRDFEKVSVGRTTCIFKEPVFLAFIAKNNEKSLYKTLRMDDGYPKQNWEPSR